MEDKEILVYGVTEGIKEYIRGNIYGLDYSLSKEEIDHQIKTTGRVIFNKPVLIDRYNKEFNDILKKSELSKDTIIEKINTLADNLTELDFLNLNKWPILKTYLTKTKDNDRFSLKYTIKQATRHVERYNNAFPNKTMQLNDYLLQNVEKYVIINGCKLGLDLAKKDKNIEIHFVLDGISMESVVNKEWSHTNSELRYLYRNRKEYSNNLKFFKNNKLVDAPWKVNSKLWENYKPKKELTKVIQNSQSKSETKDNPKNLGAALKLSGFELYMMNR